MIRGLIKKYRNLPLHAKAAIWFFACSFLQKGISTLTTPIFTRLMSTAEYGQYNVFNSWENVLTVFVTLNIYHGIYTQGYVKFHDERSIFSSSLQGLSLTLCFLWGTIYILFQKYWNGLFSLTTVQMLAMFIMMWASAAFTYWANEQKLECRYQRVVMVTVIASIAKPLLGVIFVANSNDKVTARILALALVELLTYSGCFVSQLRKGRVFYSRKFWPYALGLAIPLIPHYLSVTILSSADRIMIREMVNASSAGIYSLAYSISQVMILFNTALNQTISPWLYKKIKNGKFESVASVSCFAILIVCFANICLIAFAPEVVAVFAPGEYMDAIYVIPPISMSVLFIFMYNLFATFEFYYEKRSYIAISSVIAAVSNIILNFLFIRMFGYYAAGYTTLICYVIYAFAHYSFMKKVCKENYGNVNVFSGRILVLISVVFTLLGFLFLISYKILQIRVLLIFSAIMIIFIKRHTIIEKIQGVLKLKEN